MHGYGAPFNKAVEKFQNPNILATEIASDQSTKIDDVNIEEVFRSASGGSPTSDGQPSPGTKLLTFPLHVNDDADFMDAWKRNVDPVLEDILDARVGEQYSVCVVREGYSKHRSQPCVRINSPRRPSPANRNLVRTEICERLTGYEHASLSIRFCKGKIKDLVDDQYIDLEVDCFNPEAEIEDEEEDVEQFPHHKSYWPRPGMGASVGLFGDRMVSSTLGGYISIDKRRYLLVANHMIENAGLQQAQTGNTGVVANPIRLTSPSLADVDELNQFLQHTLRSTDARIGELLSREGHVRASDFESIVQEAQNDNLEYDTKIQLNLLNEVAQEDEAYVVGKLVSRKRHGCRQYAGSPHAPAADREDSNYLRMDWAAFETTTESRVGQNRHRYRQHSTGGLDYSKLSKTGLGNVCEQACQLEPGVPLHYVGRKSGLCQGEINPLRTLVKLEGRSTHEWVMIITNHHNETHDCLRGDSGAWLLRDDNNEAMAMIHGFEGKFPLVTPLYDVFADIQDVVGATDVRVFSGPRPAHAAEGVSSCEIAIKTKKPKRYDPRSLPRPELAPESLPLMLKRGDEEIGLLESKENSPCTPSLETSSTSSRRVSTSAPTEMSSASSTTDDEPQHFAVNSLDEKAARCISSLEELRVGESPEATTSH